MSEGYRWMRARPTGARPPSSELVSGGMGGAIPGRPCLAAVTLSQRGGLRSDVVAEVRILGGLALERVHDADEWGAIAKGEDLALRMLGRVLRDARRAM